MELKKIMGRYAKALISGEFIRFVMIGVVNVISNILLSSVYSIWLQDNLAFICGYGSSLGLSYLLNSKFTFRGEAICWSKFVRFAVSYVPNFLIQNVIVIIFMNMLGWNRIMVYGLAAIIGVPLTFICVKFFALKSY